MREYGSCLVMAKDGEEEALKSLFAKGEDIKSVCEISRHLILVAFQRQLDSQEIEEVFSSFEDKIERWQPNHRMRSLTG